MSTTMEQTKTTPSEGLKLQVRRVIRAPRARVFEAWTKPERIKQWFGRQAGGVSSVSADARVGGAYLIEMQSSCEDGAEQADQSQAPTAIGNYTEVIPDKKLVFTWTGNWNPDETTLVTVELADVAEGTELTLIHERFLTVESMGRHEQGWTASLANLAEACKA